MTHGTDEHYAAWQAEVARLLRVESLDGDYERDGYSLEQAHGLYVNREEPQIVAYFFKIRMNKLAKEAA